MATDTVPAAVPGPPEPPHGPTAPANAPRTAAKGFLASVVAPVEPARPTFNLAPAPHGETTANSDGVLDASAPGVSSASFRDTEKAAAKDPSGAQRKAQGSVWKALLLAAAQRWGKGGGTANKRLDLQKARAQAQAHQVKESRTTSVNRSPGIPIRNSGGSGAGPKGNSGKSGNDSRGKGPVNSSGSAGGSGRGGSGGGTGGGRGPGGGSGSHGGGSGKGGSGRQPGNDTNANGSKGSTPSSAKPAPDAAKKQNGQGSRTPAAGDGSAKHGKKDGPGANSGGSGKQGASGKDGAAGKDGKAGGTGGAGKPGGTGTGGTDQRSAGKESKGPANDQPTAKGPGPGAGKDQPAAKDRSAGKDQPTAKDQAIGKDRAPSHAHTSTSARTPLQKSRETGHHDGTQARRVVDHVKAYTDGARDGWHDEKTKNSKEHHRLDKAHTDPTQARTTTHQRDDAMATAVKPLTVEAIDANTLTLATDTARPTVGRRELRTFKQYERTLEAKQTVLEQIADACTVLKKRAEFEAGDCQALLEQAKSVKGGDSLLASLGKLADTARNQASEAAELATRARRAAEMCKVVLTNIQTRYAPLYKAVVDSDATKPAELRFYNDKGSYATTA